MTRDVAAAALDPNSAPALAAVAFDATLPAQATALADGIEHALGLLAGTRAKKKTSTTDETKARATVAVALHPIQTAAKRKPLDTATLRDIYHVGQTLARAQLTEVLGAANAILARLQPDQDGNPPTVVLPGIGAPQIQALAAATGAYAGADAAGGDKQRAAAGARDTIAGQLAAMAALRRAIQLAADQTFPPGVPGIATVRRSFLLPPGRPMGT